MSTSLLSFDSQNATNDMAAVPMIHTATSQPLPSACATRPAAISGEDPPSAAPIPPAAGDPGVPPPPAEHLAENPRLHPILRGNPSVVATTRATQISAGSRVS